MVPSEPSGNKGCSGQGGSYSNHSSASLLALPLMITPGCGPSNFPAHLTPRPVPVETAQQMQGRQEAGETLISAVDGPPRSDLNGIQLQREVLLGAIEGRCPMPLPTSAATATMIMPPSTAFTPVAATAAAVITTPAFVDGEPGRCFGSYGDTHSPE